MISKSKITVVIPAYNVEKTIQAVLTVIPEFVNAIIVVDDCSPDGTSDVIRQAQQQDARIFLARHSTNQGVGGAMQTAYRLALDHEADVIVKMDGDGQMDPRYINQLIEPVLNGEADYTKGNRFLHEKELMRMPYIRRIGNLGLSFLTKLASGYWNIFDPTNGYTAISATAVRQINFERLARRYFFETSMLLELGLQRLVVRDVFIPAVYGDEISSLSPLRSMFEFPPKLFLGMLRRILYLYFIRDFTAVTILLLSGSFGILFGFIWGIYFWWKSSVSGVTASTGTVMIAILSLILGIQFLLQALMMDIQNTPQMNRWNN